MTGHILQNASELVGNSSTNELGIWFHVRETRMITFHHRHVKCLVLSIGSVPIQNVIHVNVFFVEVRNSFGVRDTMFIL
jgi:hypothetical protein